LYYPPILDVRSAGDGVVPEVEAKLRESAELARQGKLAEAIALLEASPEGGAREPRWLNYRAGLFLQVGRVDEATRDIQLALQIDPRNSLAHAQQAVISVVRNDKAEALRLASEAVALDERSAAARIALSYAQQARFDIEKALATAQATVELEPDNALAWIRLAELRMSTVHLNQAVEAANRAVTISPNLGRAQAVLGFAQLTEINLAAAQHTFEKAIELDSSDPLARLGLGLAKIRAGHLVAGREELEIAVSLDPENALIRSYMGKAYFEEKRDELAGTQLESAKERDPLDPTPWLYDAIRKETENRPVEALRDLGKSIQLNGNRAVYRSSLLLDDDAATRTVDLASIYRRLGFDELARIEGLEATDTDPNNYSAHRFLSDYYVTLPRHQIARDSELLQTQLLQPVNANPVQPHLAANGLSFLDEGGSLELGFNEYTRLFARDGPSLQMDVLAGSRDTVGDNIVLSGLSGNVGYSIGHFHLESDGFRANNDRTVNITNAFVQAQISPQTKLIAEVRETQDRVGDTNTFFFDSDMFNPNFRGKAVPEQFRLGVSHNFSPTSTLLATYAHVDRDLDFDFGQGANALQQEQNDLLEVRYIYRDSLVAVSSGFGYLNGKDLVTFNLPPPLGQSQDTRPMRFENFYSYVTLRPTKTAAVTFGVSIDSFKDAEIDRRQTNPKFGATLALTPSTRARIAATRTLKRRFSTGQTLEPTQLAGFNQFFDDTDGTDAKRWGIALDHAFGREAFGGIEVSARSLLRPPAQFSNFIQDDSFRERNLRTYGYWVLANDVTLRAGYELAKWSGNPNGSNAFRIAEATTHRLSGDVRVFLRQGEFLRLNAAWVRQSGEFASSFDPFNNVITAHGASQFPIFDLGLGYQLPRRLGFVALEIRNLLDRRFNFQDFDPQNPQFARQRFFLTRIGLRF
jgi:Tfp pilus assembly protein PilF